MPKLNPNTLRAKDKPPKPGTVPHAAKRLSVSKPTVYSLIHKGLLRSYTLNRARRISDEAIDEFIAQQEAATTARLNASKAA